MVEVTVPNIATQNKIRSNKLTSLHTLHLKPEPYNSSQSSSLSQPGRATPTISTTRPCHREPTCRRSVSRLAHDDMGGWLRWLEWRDLAAINWRTVNCCRAPV